MPKKSHVTLQPSNDYTTFKCTDRSHTFPSSAVIDNNFKGPGKVKKKQSKNLQFKSFTPYFTDNSPEKSDQDLIIFCYAAHERHSSNHLFKKDPEML
jgi:hypothetical protein